MGRRREGEGEVEGEDSSGLSGSIPLSALFGGVWAWSWRHISRYCICSAKGLNEGRP